jgi:hypothetical protein
MRSTMFHPRVETLEDRLPPGDMLNSLFPPSLLLDPAALSDRQRFGPLTERASSADQSRAPSASLATGGALSPSASVALVSPSGRGDFASERAESDPLAGVVSSTPALADAAVENLLTLPSVDMPAAHGGAKHVHFVGAGLESAGAVAGTDGAAHTAPGGGAWTSGNSDPYTLYTSSDGYTGSGGMDRQTFLAMLAANGNGSAGSLASTSFVGLNQNHHSTPPPGQVDPGAMGPLAVMTQEYNFGDTIFTPTGFGHTVELIAQVKAPVDLSGGPHPLVVIMHGRHVTTYNPTNQTTYLEWPPAAGHQSIPSYKGYDYLGDVLASNGYIVVSVSANGINAFDNNVNDLGANARAQLIERHLDIWRDLSSGDGSVSGIPGNPAPFGTRFVDQVDMQNIGLMGHSRGGEGVTEAYLYNQSLGAPYGINAVFALAPVDFNRHVVNNVPLAVLLPYNDGDVNDNQGVHFFDDARYSAPGDTSLKFTYEVLGANHNYYNTIWTPGNFAGGFDDGVSGPPTRLTPAQERGTGLAYISAFFRTYLGGELGDADFTGILTGDQPPPPSAQVNANQLFATYQPPDDGTRIDVNRLDSLDSSFTNTLGGNVNIRANSYFLYGGAAPEQPALFPGETTSASARYPHTTPSARSSRTGLSQLVVDYTRSDTYFENDIPTGYQDISAEGVIQFRAAVAPNALNPTGRPQDFSVGLRDAEGDYVSFPVSYYSNALFYPPGSVVNDLPKILLNSVRIPLADYASYGVDLTNVTGVEFDFDQTPTGSFVFDDLMFAV